MIRRTLILFISAICFFSVKGQEGNDAAAKHWADSVFKKLSKDQRIAQLMVIRAHSNLGPDHVKQVSDLIKKYNIGALCFFQGGPVRQADLTNYYQSIAKTPLFIAIDGEWGLGMRLDSVINFPRQLMIGAVQDAQLVYQFGKDVGEQCKRMGVQINFAPDVDVNNNPNNPVINDRSFGEDKYKVALYGIEYMRGMQDVGVMACAKHFPGHGDTETDSHLDLPVINKSRAQLDSLELYPFRQIFSAGVGSVMIGHLYIPSIDSTPNLATSLSYNTTTKLLKDELGFKGLVFTDALEMQGVRKFLPGGEAAVQSLIAGNDMLCLPGDVAASIKKIKEAIKKKRLTWQQINEKVMKVLEAKYRYGLSDLKPVNTFGLVDDLNAKTKAIKKALAENAITLLRNDGRLLPLQQISAQPVAYLGVGITSDNQFAKRLKTDLKADVYFFDYKSGNDDITRLTEKLKNYKTVIIGVHNYSRRPQNNYGISQSAIDLVNAVRKQNKSINFLFGNPYALKNFCNAKNLLACYEDDDITQNAAANILVGKIPAKGKLSVTVCDDLKFSTGISAVRALPRVLPETVGIDSKKFPVIDSLINDGIKQRAYPGAVVLVAKDGKLVYQKAYGYQTYDSVVPMNTETIFDMASVTKIGATTVSVMKLYDEGKLDLRKTIGDYLPWVRGSDKDTILIKDILLHQAGLKAWIPFYKETIDTTTGIPLEGFYTTIPDRYHTIRVAQSMYMRTDWRDTMYKRILESPLGPHGVYVYSDNDFIFLGKIVEAITGMPLNEYVRKTFYEPLGMMSTAFLPRQHYPVNNIAPTELEKNFRLQMLRGDVHDPGSAMFGGVAGHAGLFTDAYDLAVLIQMILNKGEINGIRFFSPETVELFTRYNSDVSRRGLGFDKPEKDNTTREEPYPSKLVSPEAFGHTGYTGTCFWADPKEDLLYILFTNRVNPGGGTNTKLLHMNVRGNVLDTIYSSFFKSEECNHHME